MVSVFAEEGDCEVLAEKGDWELVWVLPEEANWEMV